MWRGIIPYLGAWVFLAGAVAVLGWAALYHSEPMAMGGHDQPSAWWLPDEPIAPLEVALWVCITKMPGSPEGTICY